MSQLLDGTAWFRVPLFAGALFALTTAAVGAEPPARKTPADTAESKEREKRLEEMHILAGRLSFEEPGDQRASPHKVIEKPLRISPMPTGVFSTAPCGATAARGVPWPFSKCIAGARPIRGTATRPPDRAIGR